MDLVNAAPVLNSAEIGTSLVRAMLYVRVFDYLRDEWVVAVTCGNCHAMVVVRDGGVFDWGYVDGLGLPEADAAVLDDGDFVFPCRYQQLSCVP